MIGQTVAHYKILEKLGEGGMGVVYRALDLRLDRHVAIKFLSGRLASDETAKKRFVREAKAASGLEHPNICHIHEIDELPDGTLFMVMPCYEGETLRERLARGPLEIGDALEIAAQIASGLATAHDKGIIHRDIKPGNIMLTDDGRQAKLMDFGLAKTLDSTKVTQSGMAVGTIAYMSPEQVLGNATDHRTDIWSLGLLLYEMLTGRLPFRGDVEAAILYSIVHEEPEPVTRVRPEVPPDVERVIGRALKKEPKNRYATMREMLRDLEEQRDRMTLGIKRLRFLTMQRRTKRRILGAGTIVGIVAAAVVLYAIFKSGPPQEAVAKKVTVIDEKGQTAERFVPNTEFRRSFALYPLDNQSGSAENDWIGTAIPLLLETDLDQDQFLTVQSPFDEAIVDRLHRAGFKNWEAASWSFKQRLAAASNLDYLVTGAFVIENKEYTITRSLHTASNGRLVTSKTYRGSNLFTLVDEMSVDLKKDADLPDTRPDNPKDLPVAELTTSSVEALKAFSTGMERGWIDRDWPRSIALVEQATQIDSTMAVAYLQLLSIYDVGNQGEKVEPTLQPLLRHLYRMPERLQFTAKSAYYILNKDADKCIAVLKMSTELYPADVAGRAELARELAVRGRKSEAIEEYKRILEIDPERAEAMQQIGALYRSTGDFTHTLEYYEMYAKKNPENATSFTGIAGVYSDIGDYDRASENYEKALLLEPENVAALYGIAWIDDILGRDDEALRRYGDALRACRSSLDRIDVYWPLGDFYIRRGQIDKSLKQMRLKWREAEKAMDPVRVLFIKDFDATQIVEGGRVSDAFAILDSVRKEAHHPYDETVELGYAYAYVELERPDSAEAALGRVKQFVEGYQIETLREYTYFVEGRIAELRGDYRGAIDRFEKSSAISPTDVFVHRYIGRCQRKLGDYEKAKASFEKTLKVLPNDSKTLYELALLYADKGQMTDAVSAIEKALAVWKNADPGYQPAEKARAKLAEWTHAQS